MSAPLVASRLHLAANSTTPLRADHNPYFPALEQAHPGPHLPSVYETIPLPPSQDQTPTQMSVVGMHLQQPQHLQPLVMPGMLEMAQTQDYMTANLLSGAQFDQGYFPGMGMN